MPRGYHAPSSGELLVICHENGGWWSNDCVKTIRTIPGAYRNGKALAKKIDAAIYRAKKKATPTRKPQ